MPLSERELLEETARREASFRLACADEYLDFKARLAEKDHTIDDRDSAVHALHQAATAREAVVNEFHVKTVELRESLREARADAEGFAWMLAAEQDAGAREQRHEKTWGWKLCAPLRALQDWLAPRKVPPAPAAVPGVEFVYYLHNSPYHLFRDGKFILKGWGFPKDGRRVTAVRARMDNLEFLGRYGLEEPEVIARHGPQPNNPKPGFKIEFSIPPGRHRLSIEARVENGPWSPFLTLPVWRV